MTVDEARALLPKYADGLLEPKSAREVESLLAGAPELQNELRRINEENEMLARALAPLRTTKSARMRLSEAMQDAHERAQNVAEALPEYGWRIARLSFVFLALAAATALGQYYPPAAEVFQGSPLFFYAIVGIFCMGLIFILAGRPLARVEARLLQRLTDVHTTEPDHEASASALEVLTVEVFGIFAMLCAMALYMWLLPH